MTKLHMRAIDALESVDVTLKGLCACIEIMQMGAQHMANGEYIDDALGMIGRILQNARAELDEAAGTVMQMRTNLQDARAALDDAATAAAMAHSGG